VVVVVTRGKPAAKIVGDRKETPPKQLVGIAQMLVVGVI